MEQLIKIIKDAKRIVFFGGAGVSTESGIPDFRSANGVFKKKKYETGKSIDNHQNLTRNKIHIFQKILIFLYF